MKFGSLFAGIGGIDLGLEWAGMECVWQVENDDYCNRVLAEHWSDVERFGDVREVGKHNLAPVDLIAGGFPCQPHSVAGKRRGAEDDRNLWPEFSRIIAELRPRYVIAENVPGIITTYIDEVLSDLENQGYTCGTFNIPAVSQYAPHRRERIFIVGYTSELGRDEAQLERPRKDRKPKRSVGGSGVGRGVEDVANSASEGDRREGKRGKAGRSKTKRSTGGSSGSGDSSGAAEDVANSSRERRRGGSDEDVSRQGGPLQTEGSGTGNQSGVLADSERERLGRGAAIASSDRRGGERTKARPQSLQPGDGEAYAGEPESGGEVVADSESGQNQQRGPRGVGETPEGGEGVNTSTRDGGQDVADSESDIRRASGDARSESPNWRRTDPTLHLAYTWGDRYIYCYWSEAIQNWQEIGVPIPHSKHTYWLPEPNVGRVAHGVPSRVDRLRGLGNAVVPQVAEWVGLRIMEFDQLQ